MLYLLLHQQQFSTFEPNLRKFFYCLYLMEENSHVLHQKKENSHVDCIIGRHHMMIQKVYNRHK